MLRGRIAHVVGGTMIVLLCSVVLVVTGTFDSSAASAPGPGASERETTLLSAADSPTRGASFGSDSGDDGRRIYQADCAVCHGTRGEGSFQGPAIDESGTAAVDFMVRTGRMPRAIPHTTDALPWALSRDDWRRSEPHYNDAQIRSLVEYTATFISGPEVPVELPIADADLAKGGSIYRAQCASCHQMAGSGGSLAYGTVGPSLHEATPSEIWEAIRTGPGSMPVFPEAVMSNTDALNTVAYVRYLANPQDRGGLSLWHIGPVPEGLVAWVVGLGMILVMCRWLGKRASPSD